ncbi:MAG: polysaccharide biosynthesis protein, partial [Chitinophagaceae bacterium]
GCVYAAVIIGFLLRFNFDIPKILPYHWEKIILGVGIINICFFGVFRTFSGIVRHTGMQDAWRVLISIFCSTIVYLLFNLVASINDKSYFLPFSVIFIAFFAAFALMFLYRIFVKMVFDQARTLAGGSHSNVVIYGAGQVGAMVCKVLQSTVKGKDRTKVVAFIEEDPHAWGTNLEGLPIYKAKPAVLDRLHIKYHFDKLVIVDIAQKSTDKETIMEWCLKNKVKIQQVPPIDQWVRTGLEVKQIKDIHIADLLNREVIQIDESEVALELTQKVILVTGAAGSIGSELARQIAGFNPSALILCDQAESPLHDLYLELKENFQDLAIYSFLGDICNKSRMVHLFDKYHPDIIFHAAAYKHVPVMEKTPDIAIINNVMGTINIAELSVKYKVSRFVMISTDKAVNPTNVMGASKRIAEIFIQSLNDHLDHENGFLNGLKNGGQSHTLFITTRFGNVLGSNGSVVPRFKKQIEQGGPLTVTHPEVIRFFMTIPEACRLVLQAVTMGNGGEVFAFDMGAPVKIADLANKMIRLSGLEPEKDIKVVYTGLRPGEKMYEEVLGKEEEILPTSHKKIMIAKVRNYNFVAVKEDITALIRLARQGDVWEVVSKMKYIVPEYK